MNHAQGAHHHPPPFLPEEIWEECRIIVSTLIRYTISPQELLERQAITPLLKSQILKWLRPVETIVRHLLLIMAKTMRPAPTRTCTRVARGRAPRDFNPSFRWPHAMKEAPQQEEQEKRPPREPRRWERVVVVSRPTAERLEAIARVIENPEPYAKRLARRMQAHPEEAEAPPALEADPPEPTADIPLRDLTRETHAHARTLYPKKSANDRASLAPPSNDSS